VKNVVKTEEQTNLNVAFVEALCYLQLTVTIKHLFSTCSSTEKQISRNSIIKFGDTAELDAQSSVCVHPLTVIQYSSVTVNMGQVVEMTVSDDAK
jgi:hypothetical protein